MENRKTASPISEYHLNRHRPARPHIHSFYQLIWFRKGGGRHVVDFRERNVADNAVFFIAKNQVHCFDNGTAYGGVPLHFNEAFLVKNETDFFLKRSLFGNPYEPPFCAVGRETERLLAHSGLNVGQIGYRLGFDDPSYFVKYFKKHAGVSPSAFRKSVS